MLHPFRIVVCSALFVGLVVFELNIFQPHGPALLAKAFFQIAGSAAALYLVVSLMRIGGEEKHNDP